MSIFSSFFSYLRGLIGSTNRTPTSQSPFHDSFYQDVGPDTCDPQWEYIHPDDKQSPVIDLVRMASPTVQDLRLFNVETYGQAGMLRNLRELHFSEEAVNHIHRSRNFMKVSGVNLFEELVNTNWATQINQDADGDFQFLWWPSDVFPNEYLKAVEDSYDASVLAVQVGVIFSGTSVSISYDGCLTSVEAFEEEILNEWVKTGLLGPEPISVNWIYKTDMGMGRLQQPLVVPHEVEGAYPWLNGSVQEFADRYMNSTANILLIQGPRGTGKTTFLKQLIEACGVPSRITYDKALLESDSLFIDFIKDREPGLLIVEDNDNLLRSRENGNDAMARILNIGDGVISFVGKKMIFTTNLDNLDSVDSALTRPGRCFDILKFRNLTDDEAKVVVGNVYEGEVALPASEEGHSLAYLLNCIDAKKKPVEARISTKLRSDAGSDLDYSY